MTMERNTKAESLKKYQDTRAGARTERSVSPRQLAKYGRLLPAAVAAPFFLSCERRTHSRSREGWMSARLLLAEATRDRTRKA